MNLILPDQLNEIGYTGHELFTQININSIIFLVNFSVDIFLLLKNYFKQTIFLLFVNGSVLTAHAASIPPLCDGPSAFINIIDRPTAAFSACAVPYKKAALETGYEYQSLTHSAGNQQNAPEAEFRLGLPANSELTVILPNYIHQTSAPYSGFTATTIGIKHEVAYAETWLASVQGFVTPSSGSSAFGSNGTGAALFGIFTFTITEDLGASFMLGGNTQTQSAYEGGKRYNSIVPDLVVGYSLNPMTALYIEAYGQTKTAPDEGSGYNADGGIIYLLFPNLALDLEVGQRISGNLGGFNHYIGAGLSVMF